MSATNFHDDYIAALVQLQRQGVCAINGVRISEQIAQALREREERHAVAAN